MSHYDQEAVEILIAGHRQIADQLLELRDRRAAARPPAGQPAAPGGLFDPEFEAPWMKPRPHGQGDPVDWSIVVFFGRLRAVNVRHGRGADRSEQLAIARDAGYENGRKAFNGWTWAWQDRGDARWITDEGDLSPEDVEKGRWSGMKFLRESAKKLGITLPNDLVAPDQIAELESGQ